MPASSIVLSPWRSAFRLHVPWLVADLAQRCQLETVHPTILILEPRKCLIIVLMQRVAFGTHSFAQYVAENFTYEAVLRLTSAALLLCWACVPCIRGHWYAEASSEEELSRKTLSCRPSCSRSVCWVMSCRCSLDSTGHLMMGTPSFPWFQLLALDPA